MNIHPVKTKALMPPQDDLFALMEESLVKVPEQSVVVVTSKVVAIHQGRCVPLKEGGVEREELAQKEADWFVSRHIVPGDFLMFTIKNGIMIASAGIDKSNANGFMVLWPEEPMEWAKRIWEWLREKFGLKEVGVIISDSHTTMMRRGTQGIALGYWGFKPVRDYRGRSDIFGRKLVVQRTNIADSLAIGAVMEMGEGQEQTPLAVVSDIREMEFSDHEEVILGEPGLRVPLEEDLFYPMISALDWKQGGGGIGEEELSNLKTDSRSGDR